MVGGTPPKRHAPCRHCEDAVFEAVQAASSSKRGEHGLEILQALLKAGMAMDTRSVQCAIESRDEAIILIVSDYMRTKDDVVGRLKNMFNIFG